MEKSRIKQNLLLLASFFKQTVLKQLNCLFIMTPYIPVDQFSIIRCEGG
jgi:hypothetical protein